MEYTELFCAECGRGIDLRFKCAGCGSHKVNVSRPPASEGEALLRNLRQRMEQSDDPINDVDRWIEDITKLLGKATSPTAPKEE